MQWIKGYVLALSYRPYLKLFLKLQCEDELPSLVHHYKVAMPSTFRTFGRVNNTDFLMGVREPLAVEPGGFDLGYHFASSSLKALYFK